MAQPTEYDRQSSFSNIQAQAPSDPLPGNLVDAEFNAVKVTLDETLANLALIQRDDGALANASVGLAQLSEEIEVGWQAPVVWTTATAFVTGNTVFHGSAFYRLKVAHTSGTFATDLAAGKWEEIVDLSDLTIVAASQIANTPSGSIAATTVQAAIDELASEKAAASHSHPSSAITDGTAAGRALLTAASAAAQRAALGLGDLALEDTVPVTDIGAEIALSGIIEPAALASSVNDWAPTGVATCSTIRVSASAADVEITGLLAGATDGEIKILENIGTTYPLVLPPESSSSAAANRFTLGGAVVLAPKEAIALKYDKDATTPRWRAVMGASRPLFQCQLTKSGSNLALGRLDGTWLFINGANQRIPAAGVTLAPPATDGIKYFIYAYMSSGTMTLEASTTAYAADAAYGHKIKSGDATRTLVGMAYTVSSAWVDSTTQRYVRSYYNDPGATLLGWFSADRTTTSTSYVEINSEIRLNFIVWTGETVIFSAGGFGTNSSGVNTLNSTALGFNGTTPEEPSVGWVSGGAVGNGFALPRCDKSGLTEGYAYCTLLGKVTSGTGTWVGSGSAGTRTALTGFLRRRS